MGTSCASHFRVSIPCLSNRLCYFVAGSRIWWCKLFRYRHASQLTGHYCSNLTASSPQNLFGFFGSPSKRPVVPFTHSSVGVGSAHDYSRGTRGSSYSSPSRGRLLAAPITPPASPPSQPRLRTCVNLPYIGSILREFEMIPYYGHNYA